MAAIKSKNTSPEIILGKAMWKRGLRYRKHDKSVFGTPDFTFKKYKVAVFVDSEFFHGKDWETKKKPVTNAEFWERKISRNIARDLEVNNFLIANNCALHIDGDGADAHPQPKSQEGCPMKFAALLLVAAAAAPLSAQSADGSDFATPAEIHALVTQIGQGMKAGQIFAMKPLVKAGVSVASVEYWKGPGRPAIHPTDAEYAIVVEGSGTLVSGGTMTDQEITNPGLTQGGRIEGGRSRPLAPGDVIMIPAGVPHWFGVDGGKLALLGIKLPQPRP